MASTRRMGASLKKGGVDILEESEDVDGLIKWAKNLPDDVAMNSQSSFFQLK